MADENDPTGTGQPVTTRRGLLASAAGLAGGAAVGSRVIGSASGRPTNEMFIDDVTASSISFSYVSSATPIQIRWDDYVFWVETPDSPETVGRPPIAPDRTYEIEVDQGDPSTTVSETLDPAIVTTPPADSPAPGGPEFRWATFDVTETEVVVGWTAAGDETNRVHVGAAPVTDRVVEPPVTHATAADGQATLTGLDPETAYFLQAWTETVENGEVVAESAPIEAEVTTAGSIAPPGDLSLAPAEGGIDLSWTAPAESVERYAVRVVPDNLEGVFRSVPASETSVTIDALPPGSVVDVSVEAVTGDGRSVPARAVVRTAPDVPQIDGVRPRDLDGDGIHADFNGNGRIDFPDVNRYFQHADDRILEEHTALFDINGDGQIDLQDPLTLFEWV
ncbi:fibronectin type III domain-containing protein [Halococcoides cellulosivorans]|uniref:Fibronectin type-III domain-containing protein n=1 Tax=Halococcoides cellulosivorans TaxID=1679096 RepID=A0A2R4WXV9_9EURY|nr:fibronectin type III domain-containing protein [Halococcoides cellulosivorans]AWB26374.1 hypothetical protein HARCEL1_00885 [Halococcoides cellulosivorans]